MNRIFARKSWLAAAASLLVIASGAATAQTAAPAGAEQPAAKAVTIYQTAAPGGWFGFNGPDVYDDQRVAVRFSVPADGDMRLARIGIYFMNNSATKQPKMRITLQQDALDVGGAATAPSGKVLESWTAPVATVGWEPKQQFFKTTKGPLLKAGRNYWVVAESRAKAGADPIWLYASKGVQWNTLGHADMVWYDAGESGALTLRVDAAPAAQ